jgi:hypothetical protein
VSGILPDTITGSLSGNFLPYLGCKYAYFAWVDQHAADNLDPRPGSGVFDLYDTNNLGYQPLDLVPTIWTSQFASGADGNGYARVDTLRWGASGGIAGVRTVPLRPGQVLVISVQHHLPD